MNEALDAQELHNLAMNIVGKDLEEQGYDFNKVPVVLQWNKRDLPNVSPIQDLESKLNERDLPSFECIATTGEGVFETLKMVSKLVLLNIKGGLDK